MNKFTLHAIVLLACALPCFAQQANDIVIKKVEVDFPPTPEFATNIPALRAPVQKWVKMETVFDSAADFTDELAFTYYVLFGEPGRERVLVGNVTNVSIVKGRDLHTVMYISPKSIQKLLGRKPVSSNVPILQVSVVASKPGTALPISVQHYKPGAQGEWWTNGKQEEGYIVNKSETPFAPLFWDYYEAIKPASAH